MKLNYKRTILVGFAFFLICAFWQAYDNTVPLILTNKFGMSQTWSGVIMAMDNVLALFLLPLFGHISDKCTHPRGRRTPFIVVGTLIAAVALIALSFADNAQLKRLDKVSAIDDPAALTVIYNEQKDATLLSPSGESFILGHRVTEAEFTASRSQTLTRAQPQRSSAGRAAAISAVRIQIQAPAARSPPGVFGKRRRNSRSSSEMRCPIAATGCGRPCGSPISRSRPNPMQSANRDHFMPVPSCFAS